MSWAWDKGSCKEGRHKTSFPWKNSPQTSVSCHQNYATPPCTLLRRRITHDCAMYMYVYTMHNYIAQCIYVPIHACSGYVTTYYVECFLTRTLLCRHVHANTQYNKCKNPSTEWVCRDEMHHVKNSGKKEIPLAIHQGY